MPLNDFLALLAQALLVVALPIVIAAAVQHFRVMTQRLRASGDAARWDTIERAIKLAVTALEYSGIGAEARDRAVRFAQDFLDERGVRIDADRLAALIEAEARQQIANPTMPSDTPLARQALLQAAVEAAVLAAEQSGLKGIIQNTAVGKKAYAMDMAHRYLAQHGINVDEGLISGLIEAQLFRMYLAERERMSGSASS